MNQEVGPRRLLEGRREGLDQVVRQVPDEPDRVGEGVDPAVGGRRAPGRRIERGEQRVLHQHTGTGEPVEQAGLAGVGVADDGDADGTSCRRRSARLVSRVLSISRSAARSFAIRLLIRRRSVSSLVSPGPTAADAGAAAGPATGLAGQVAAPASQPLLEVLQLGQLDLSLTLGALGVLGEDVEDQRGPVDDLDLDLVLEVAQLRRGQLAVADHRVGAGGDHDVAQLLDLAPADVGGRVGPGRRWIRPSSTSEPAVSASSLSSAIAFSASTSLPVVHTLTSTTRSSSSWRYSTSVMSVSSVDIPGDAAQRDPVREILLVAVPGLLVGSDGEIFHDYLVMGDLVTGGFVAG